MEKIINFEAITELLGEHVDIEPKTTQIHVTFKCGCVIIQDILCGKGYYGEDRPDHILPCQKHQSEIRRINIA